MLGFSRLRQGYSGKINKIAYLGFAGDIAVFVGLCGMYKMYKMNQEAKLPAIKEKALAEAL